MKKGILSYAALKRLDKHERHKYIEDTLKINSLDIGRLHDICEAATLLHTKSLEAGLSKAQALNQIRHVTLAAILLDDTSVSANFRINKILQEMYGDGSVPLIEALRRDTFEHVHYHSFIPNSTKAPEKITYSVHDTAQGTRIPDVYEDMDPSLALLIGSYFAAARPAKNNLIYFDVTRNNRLYMEDILVPLIRHYFNRQVSVNAVLTSKKSGFTDNECAFEKLSMGFASQAHYQFVTYVIPYLKKDGKKVVFSIPQVIQNMIGQEDMWGCYEAFFAGIVNASGCLVKENKSRLLAFFSTNNSYLEQIQYVAYDFGYTPSLKYKRNSSYLRFSRKDTIHMAESQTVSVMCPAQVGYFINPVHLERIGDLYLKR